MQQNQNKLDAVRADWTWQIIAMFARSLTDQHKQINSEFFLNLQS